MNNILFIADLHLLRNIPEYVYLLPHILSGHKTQQSIICMICMLSCVFYGSFQPNCKMQTALFNRTLYLKGSNL